MHSLRHAVRQLAKAPGYTFTAMVTLMLGIGASTAIFSVVHALLLSPLQYRAADELVQIQSVHREQGTSGLAPATFGDVAHATHSFDRIAAQYYYYLNLTGIDTPALLNSGDVSAEFFKVFDVAPLRGRSLGLDDFKPGAPPVVVLSHALWRSQFNGRESIIGQTILLDDIAHLVIGVMPATFKDPSETAQLWRPMVTGADNLLDRSSRYWTVFGRLKPGGTLDQANTELAVLSRQLQQAHPKNYDGWELRAADLRLLVVGNYHRGLLVVLGAVACVMTITCANLAGLSLVRAAARRKELAIRSALGSTPWELIRLLLSECLILALAGGAGGVLLAVWGVEALLESLPPGWVPRTGEITINLPVLAASVALTLITGLVTGLAPGFTASRIDANDALKDSSRSTSGQSVRRWRTMLVTGEIALALVLLTATALLGRSFVGLIHKEPGLDAGRVLSLTLSLPGKRYNDAAKCWDFFSRALTEVAAVPSVECAGFTQTSPFRWGIPVGFVPIRGDNATKLDDYPQAFTDAVSLEFFKALGIPLRAGRLFTASDDHRAPPRVILSETAARRYFGAENPIGRFIASGPEAKFEVVGVVGDVRRGGLTVETPLQVYRSMAQRTPPFATLMVRTSLPPTQLAKSIQQALWRVDRDIPISDIATMETFVNRSVTQPRLYLVLFSLFAALALVLATIAVYGLIAYSVEQRTRELGIRTALGASPRDVLHLVLREAASPILTGVGLGILGAFATSRLLDSMLFETSVRDPGVFVISSIVLVAVAALASWLPARRAARVDPIIALRAE